MDAITTTIQREWFVEIVERRKRIEYREVKPYWTKRLKTVRVPFKLVLRNGMWPPVPVVTVRIDKITASRERRKQDRTYALHIGRVLKVEHWDRRRQCPKR